MLRTVTGKLRRRAGKLLAVLYLACVIWPVVALAFADGAAAAHCLSDEHHVAATVHVHADGTAHHHASQQSQHKSDRNHADSDSKNIPANCCGLFCLNATTADFGVSLGVAPCSHALAPTLESAIPGRGPSRIDRPPNVLASL